MIGETCQSCPVCDENVNTAVVRCPNCNAYLEELPTVREWGTITLLFVTGCVLLLTIISLVVGGLIWLMTREIQALYICVAFGATLGFTLGIGLRFVALIACLLRRRISRTSKSYNRIVRVAMSSVVMTSITIAVVIVTRLVVGAPAPPVLPFYCLVVLGSVLVGAAIGLLASGW